MRLAILTQYYRPEMGAPQNRLFEMAAGLKRLGWEVSVITAMPNYPLGAIFGGYKNRLHCEEVLDGIPVRRHWLYASNSRRALPRILSMLSFSLTALGSLGFLRRSGLDYLLVESPPLTLGLSGWLLSRLSGAKLVFNVSDLWPLTARELGALSDGWLYRRLESVERFVYTKSFICMGQSQEIVDYLGAHGAKRAYLFRNGVDPARFVDAVSASSAAPVELKIVYAGLLGVAQGILDICRHIDFRELGTEFHIYGAGSEQEGLEALVRERPGRGIFYHGTVSREDIPAVLGGYSATLIALTRNIYGAVPSKIYESMAAGLPILFSGDGEGRRIIEANGLGWTFSPGDYEALKAGIRRLAACGPEMAEKRRNCLCAAAELFNRPRQIEALGSYLAGMAGTPVIAAGRSSR